MTTTFSHGTSQHLNVPPAKRFNESISQNRREESLSQIVSGVYDHSNVIDDAIQDENRNPHVRDPGAQTLGIQEVVPCPDIPEAPASPCNIIEPISCETLPWNATGHEQPVAEPSHHDARRPQLNNTCTPDPQHYTLWVGSRVMRDYPIAPWLHQPLPVDLRLIPRRRGGAPPSETEPKPDLLLRAATTPAEPMPRRRSTRSTSNTSTLIPGAQTLISSLGQYSSCPH